MIPIEKKVTPVFCQFTAVEEDVSGVGKRHKVLMRSYKILMKKSGTKLPRIELEEMGPRADLAIRRTHLASEDLFKSACKQVRIFAIYADCKLNASHEARLKPQHGWF